MRRSTALAVQLFAGCFDLSLSTSTQFTLEIYAADTNCKKNTKTPILEVQGHSRSSMFTPIKSLSILLVTISSMSLPICNRFHATRANSGKITTFGGLTVFDARLHRPPKT